MKNNYMKRLWQLADGEHKALKLSIFLAVIGVLLGMLPYFGVSKIVYGLFVGNKDFSFYLPWCFLILIGYCLKPIFYAKALAESHKATFSVLRNVRIMLLEKLPKMPLGTIIDTHSGDLKTTIVDQVEKMERPLAHLLPEMTANILGPVSIFIYLLILDWRMALLSLVSIPVGMFFMSLIMKGYAEDYSKSVATNTEMNKTIVEYVGGIEVIKTFNQGEKSYGKFTDKVIANASFYYHWMKKCQMPVSLSKNISPTTLITVLPVGWIMFINGSLEMSTFITTIILSLGIAGPLLAAINFVDALAQTGTTVGRIDEILNGTEQVHRRERVHLKNHDIAIKNLHFSYEPGEEVIKGIDMVIQERSLNAFVGPSGSGKSTIAKLIAGFWDVEQGEISIGGINLFNIPLEQLYDLVAFVSQDVFLFNDTIMENIRMGKPSASDEEVIEIAKASGCHDFIMSLEHGYQTKVGSGGNHLSGGEKQRITIARAMIKDAPIIILDEATAYIDPENEQVLQKAINKLIQGKTIIMIAHRLSTITNADQIYLINHGKLVASGNHEELLKENKIYQAMWEAHIGGKEVA